MASNPPDDAVAVPVEGEEAAASAAEIDLNSASVIAVPPGVPCEVLSETLNDSSEVIAGHGVGDESSEKGGEEVSHSAGAEFMVEAASAGGDGGGQHPNEVAESVVSSRGNRVSLTDYTKFEQGLGLEEDKSDAAMSDIGDPNDTAPGAYEEKALESEAVVSSRGNRVSLTDDTKFEQGLGLEEDKRDAAMTDIGDPKDASPEADEEKALDKGNSAKALIDTDIDMHDAGASSGGDIQVREQEVPKKRGRGRPRLSDAEKSRRIGKKKQSRGTSSPQAKREVARPSSSAVKNAQQDSQVEGKCVTAREEQASSKRKRGRPLRYTEEGLELAEQSEDESSCVIEKASSLKTKRGRPKLSKVENVESSEISEDDSSQIGEPSSSLRRPRGKPCRLALDIVPESRYSYAFQDETKDGSTVSDLVWGKVKSHPWWPGQVFASSDASDAASSIQKKDHFLVAYFGDRTFAWCDESQLKPFQKSFSHMEKQNIAHAFVTAVNDSLLEVSRRIELGMVCNCAMNEAYADMKDLKIKNAGIREGTSSSTVDKAWITDHFEPARLLEYIQNLAKAPHSGADRMDLAIAKSQLKAFRRSKEHPEVPGFVLGGDLEDDDADPSSKKENSVNGKTDPSTPVPSEKQKSRGRGGSSMKDKHAPTGVKRKKELSEPMEEKVDDDLEVDGEKNQPGLQPSARSSVKRRKVVDSDSSSFGKMKKKTLDSLDDSETKSPSCSGKKGSKVGERVLRVTEMFSVSPSMLKPNGETVKTIELNGDVSRGYSSPSEILSQLQLIALHPLEPYSFLPAVISFFSDFKYWMVSSSSEDVKACEIVRCQCLNRKPVNLELERQEPDSIQDSYWTDIIISEKLVPDTGKGKVRSHTPKSRKSKKQENVSVCSRPVDLMPAIEGSSEDGSTTASVAKEEDGFDVTVCHSHDKTEEFRPTELMIAFPELDALPNINELITIFGRYGPLKEGEAEVVEDAKFAKVVFQRCSDAEAACNHAEKQNIFGQIAVRCSIRVLNSSSKV